MDSLTPSDLFSPSKARQQRAQAQDWAQIDSWLSYKYAGRTVPAFERNDETLKVLRELSVANERADEERAVFERVEREALRELDESIAHVLIYNTTTSQNLTNQLAHIATLQGYVDKQQSLLRTQLHELQTNPAFTTPANLQRQTTEQTRQVKHLRTKIREYEDKLSSLQSSQSRSMTPGSKSIASAEAINDMLEQQKALDGLREKVEGIEREVAEFAGLPADKEAARKEVGKLEVKLDEVRRRRDELFEGLVTQ
ncbi:hypothetical protein COCC4DRAFT_32970 [Bipolaris maydis ATCC 48331]|uniref:Uncharacterized protein n=2 Tax=Cochliobolus heterostrophus TaxID=5016 RepID=M2UEJ0_COCH5|nr:uncharacterized protein COCC4DRAFT_32970 [Bipolaris maydis ATCC 48331]EMD96959.1 hypothetical protein COCHEDRAFT_1018656 [Bipolaris maydis C5]KAJ6211588.1 hypothetical protein PSV09DRAFT_1018656 [Bipolaris maydis]ENI03829.1 hypothetical protein COCC4DRAFT_32970 [Bipolaris maydis ATCC 48331]KAJ6273952.1 hypothetical protein PSV08DRAFT_278401 [Bipolaris maydis]KAJ6285175.1 hypothetical protein J3E71DRAFT_270701 [Bipolaris maydis]